MVVALSQMSYFWGAIGNIIRLKYKGKLLDHNGYPIKEEDVI